MFPPSTQKPSKKTEQQIHQDAWITMHKKEWLFPQNFEVPNGRDQITYGPTSSEEYLNEFSRGQRLFLLRCPAPYKESLLEQYKDKVAFSAHLTSGPAIVPYTILQLNGKVAHAIADWIWDGENERFIFPTTLFVASQLDYVKFLQDNRDHECELKEERLGFGAQNPG